VKFGIRVLHIILLRIREFYVNQCREGDTFLVGKNEITFTYVL
jgi:hypothetical protein